MKKAAIKIYLYVILMLMIAWCAQPVKGCCANLNTGNLYYSLLQSFKASQYLLPDADSYYYTDADIQDMTVQIVCYAKNEIYARHGRKFNSTELTEYFNSRAWYSGTIEPSDFSDSVFNSYESANILLLKNRENELQSGGYTLDVAGYSFDEVNEYLGRNKSSSSGDNSAADGQTAENTEEGSVAKSEEGLKNWLIQNGNKDSDGDSYIQTEDDNGTYKIYYNESEDVITFYAYINRRGHRVYMNISVPNEKATVKTTSVLLNSEWSFFSITSATFKGNSTSDGFLYMSFAGWSDLLKAETGLTMADIGFTSYEN